MGYARGQGFDRVLVPVDLTPKNGAAVEIAADLCASAGKVTLIHVIETLDLPWEEVEDFYLGLEERARKRMGAMAEPLRRASLEHDQVVVYGRRAEEVVRYAEEEGYALIVLSSHTLDPENPGKSWATLSHKVAILARCPVLLVK
jgi:nucleotide-binding universal stress UspA family protein